MTSHAEREKFCHVFRWLTFKNSIQRSVFSNVSRRRIPGLGAHGQDARATITSRSDGGGRFACPGWRGGVFRRLFVSPIIFWLRRESSRRELAALSVAVGRLSCPDLDFVAAAVFAGPAFSAGPAFFGRLVSFGPVASVDPAWIAIGSAGTGFAVVDSFVVAVADFAAAVVVASTVDPAFSVSRRWDTA